MKLAKFLSLTLVAASLLAVPTTASAGSCLFRTAWGYSSGTKYCQAWNGAFWYTVASGWSKGTTTRFPNGTWEYRLSSELYSGRWTDTIGVRLDGSTASGCYVQQDVTNQVKTLVSSYKCQDAVQHALFLGY
jgi:hypothetical protein